ncbi:MAG: hypothetical protein LBV40_05105 [Methanomicrobiales archaeon]|jgi:hypothetical protein|nr:hypothetical protein [Methanomicrobiales archaeon]
MTERNRGKLKRITSHFLLALIIIAFILGTGLALTNLSIEPDLSIERVTPYPYAIKYAIEIVPDETSYIGSVSLMVSLAEDSSVSITTNEKVSLMNIGESKKITERRAQIAMFGVTIFETNYRVEIKYLGPTKHSSNPEQAVAAFDASIETSERIPEFILSHVVPVNVSINTVASTS